MLLVAPVVVDVLWRASPFPRPGHALMHRLVVGDVVDVEAPEVLVVLTRNLRCLVEDLPAVVAGSLSVVQRARVPGRGMYTSQSSSSGSYGMPLMSPKSGNLFWSCSSSWCVKE